MSDNQFTLDVAGHGMGPATLSLSTIRASLKSQGLKGKELSKATFAEMRKMQAPIAAYMDKLRSDGYTYGGIRSTKTGKVAITFDPPKPDETKLSEVEAERDALARKAAELEARLAALERRAAESTQESPFDKLNGLVIEA